MRGLAYEGDEDERDDGSDREGTCSDLRAFEPGEGERRSANNDDGSGGDAERAENTLPLANIAEKYGSESVGVLGTNPSARQGSNAGFSGGNEY